METWRSVPSLEGAYQVSSHGRVRRSRGKILSQSFNSGGYFKVCVCVRGRERTVNVHRLVAEAFLGSPPAGRQVNHRDGVKTNNQVANLEYVTPAGNGAHAAELGLTARGPSSGRYTKPARTARGTRVNTAKINDRKARELRAAWERGTPLSVLMKRFGLSKSATWQVATGKSWSHVR